MKECPNYMSKGVFQQMHNFGHGDIHFHGNPQNGCWSYGYDYGERNPYCPTLAYSIYDYTQVKENNKHLDPKLKNSFQETYSGQKILFYNFKENHKQYLQEISSGTK